MKPEVREFIGLGDRTEDDVDIVEDRKGGASRFRGGLQITTA